MQGQHNAAKETHANGPSNRAQPDYVYNQLSQLKSVTLPIGMRSNSWNAKETLSREIQANVKMVDCVCV